MLVISRATQAIIAMISAFAALLMGFSPAADFNNSLGYYSYAMSKNESAGKIAYLDRNFKKYGGYIIGGTQAEALAPKFLNAKSGVDFYNLSISGGNLYHMEKNAAYALNRYGARHIVLALDPYDAVVYGENGVPLHGALSGENLAGFYYNAVAQSEKAKDDMLKSYLSRGALPTATDRFDAETGCPRISKSDLENPNINSLRYWNFTPPTEKVELTAAASSLASADRIARLCKAYGAKLTVIMLPLFDGELDAFDINELSDFMTRLAGITDFWNFAGHSSVSCDKNYFYTGKALRPALGDMVLRRAFGRDGGYLPQDFGKKITEGNCKRVLLPMLLASAKKAENSVSVPILMYHAVEETGDYGIQISAQHFDEHMSALKNAGYNTVITGDLIDYAERGVPLPQNPVMITFDDGYADLFEYAYPILQKYDMRATVNLIGFSMGKSTYKHTGKPITQHLSYEQARQMYQSGLVDFQSHTFDMHQVKSYGENELRQGIIQLEGENQRQFASAVRRDVRMSKYEIEREIGNEMCALAYPYGTNSDLAQLVLAQEGIKATVTTKSGGNYVTRGFPQSLYRMNRYNAIDGMSGEALLKLILEEK